MMPKEKEAVYSTTSLCCLAVVVLQAVRVFSGLAIINIMTPGQAR
jgi:hypothetical protein